MSNYRKTNREINLIRYIERLISTLCYFFSYFFWSVNCMNQNCISWISEVHNIFWHVLKKLSHFLSVSKLYELSLWIIQRILDKSRSLSINLCLRLLVLPFMESSTCTVCTYSAFSLTCKLYKFGLQIIHVISDNFKLMGSFDVGGYLVYLAMWY